MSSVMTYSPESSSYTNENSTARKSDKDFIVKQILYNEYQEAKRNHFQGTFEEYLSYRDYA